jgi:hypothetical protein
MEQDFLRDQAFQLRAEAEAERDLSIKSEILELAMACEEVSRRSSDQRVGAGQNQERPMTPTACSRDGS